MYEVFMQAIKEAKSISTLKEIIREVNADEGLSGRGRQFILIQEAYKKMKEIPLEHVIRELAEYLL